MADGEDVSDLVPKIPGIHLIHVEHFMHIGDKRNYGCSRATGEVIAHWDDDDWSAPDRLRHQVDLMVRTKKPVVGYRTMKFRETGTDKWWMYNGTENYVIGTSFLYRKDYWERNPFPSMQVGEDIWFLNQAISTHDVVSVGGEGRMYATIHPGNTSPRQLRGNTWLSL